MRKDHKVEITRKDLYVGNYSNIIYSSLEFKEGDRSYIKRSIVDILVKIIKDFN